MFPTIHDRRIKIAVVGCGRISGKHFDAIDQHKQNLQLVAVCDRDREVLARTERSLGIQAFDRLDTLLAQSDADLVCICTPSGLHPSEVIRCAKAGKHVMTEKPMATRWADGIAMVKACDKARVRFFCRQAKSAQHNLATGQTGH
jgi:UDP-N-acetyl-2-amino-2-deoxyglucuronate dehydrogenase